MVQNNQLDAKYSCSLVIRSSDRDALPEGLIRSVGLSRLEFTDNCSAERLAQIARIGNAGFTRGSNAPRYCWILSTDGEVSGFDIEKHIRWLIANLHPSWTLKQLRELGYDYSLSFYWEGNGTGGGPCITASVAEILMRHNANLQFNFYLQDDDEQS